MEPGLRRAWTEIVQAEDYEQHMAAVGQAQAAAGLTAWLMESAGLPQGCRITIAGAGTGQLFDFLAPSVFAPYQLTCSDLNPAFLSKLGQRLEGHGLDARLVEDDIERTTLAPGMDLLLATLLLEHIDWRRGVKAFASLGPRFCGIILQENPPGMTSAVTPGRVVPPSLVAAMEIGHATLVPREELIEAMAAEGYHCRATEFREVADGKRLAALLFVLVLPGGCAPMSPLLP